MTLYARAITLRNCGRFTVIASDFGADYRTHTHVTGQALYASLTRGAAWRAGGQIEDRVVYPCIQIKDDRYDFDADYDLKALPIWFTPGLFVGRDHNGLTEEALDAGYFNVVHEVYPTTSKQFKFDRGGTLEQTSRPAGVPTYGTWQGVLPDQRLHTVALARDASLLEAFEEGKTYLLGKKRTMMQITSLSEIMPGESKYGFCQTGLLQLAPDKVRHLRSFDVVAATMRYLLLYGETRDPEGYVEFKLTSTTGSDKVALPNFYLEDTPLA